MAWIMHSSGPWRDHKYKERSGSPGNYTYKYGTTDSENDNTAGGKYNSYNQNGDRENNKKTMVQANKVMTNYLAKNDDVIMSTRVHTKGQGSQRRLMFSYANDRSGYQVNNKGLVGGEEAEKAREKRNARRKDFEKMTLTSMRNAMNSAKENKKQKSDADMRDAAVARGREQYMTNRAKKTVGAMTKAIEKKREEEKRKAYDHSRLKRIMGR